MKFIKKFTVFTVLAFVPMIVFSQDNLTSSELATQLQKLLTQYAERVRLLEAENAMLKSLMAKHEIQIPLEEYNKLVTATGTITSPIAISTNSATTNTPTVVASPLRQGFIDMFRTDWHDVRKAYGMPENAYIGAYEFVKNDAGNNVFVDIVYGDGTPEGAYNAKLAYEFNKTTFKRTFIGFFEYDTTSKMYITRKGKNPFVGVEREVIPENTSMSISTTLTTPSTPSTPVVNTTDSSVLKIESDMLAAYNKKDYNTLLKISEDYLKKETPTYKIRLYRYRSYFLLGQYTQALGEIKKMENEKLADEKIYCDGSVVAQYAKNTTLATQYRKLAGSGCVIKS